LQILAIAALWRGFLLYSHCFVGQWRLDTPKDALKGAFVLLAVDEFNTRRNP
jgi:hypothetical protein